MNTNTMGSLLLLGPTVAAAVLLSTATATGSPLDPTSPRPVSVSGDQIDLVQTGHEWLPLKPRGNATDDNETAEEAWESIPGGPGTGGRLSESTIKSECKSAGGAYATAPTGGGNTSSTCTYTDIDGHRYKDFYDNGRYWGTSDA